jgi:Domain of unknown function (DUF1992)
MSMEDLIESRISDAMAAGAFEGLRGAGKPFRFDPRESLGAGEDWLGHKILQNGDLLPPWLMLAKEIERETTLLAEVDKRHAEWVGIASASGQWHRHAGALRRLRADYEGRARALRRKQDRFNMDAPSIALERPGIWVERELLRLDDRLRDAGAPDDLLSAVAAG